MARLQTISLPNNNLFGSIPPDFFHAVKNLTVIDLSYNELSGTLPTELGLLRNADEFLLDHNLLQGRVPTELGLLGSGAASKINLGVNPLSGVLPTELKSLSNLEYLGVGQTNIEGTLPPLASSLQILHAEYSAISGHLTARVVAADGSLVSDLQLLRSVSFSGSSLSGTLPSELGVEWLTRATFAATSISGTIPSQLGHPKGLQLLDAARTSLSGTLPTELFERSGRLNTINLFDTQLSGTLPTLFATLGSLRNLYVPRELTQYLRQKYACSD